MSDVLTNRATVESRLYQEGFRGLWTACAVSAALAGVSVAVILPRFQDAWRQAGSLHQVYLQSKGLCGACGIVVWIVVFAGLFVAIAVSRSLRNRPFEHAAPGVLPDVPSVPLLVPGARSHMSILHRWFPTPGGGVLRPPGSLDRKYTWSTVLFTACVYLGLLASLWLPDLGVGLWTKIYFSVFFLLASVLSLVSCTRLHRQTFSSLVEVHVDRDEGVCRLVGPYGERSLALSQLAAVQLCAARRKLCSDSDPSARSTENALEINLVCRPEQAGGGELSRYDRYDVLLMVMPVDPKVIGIVRQLADALGVPLLNHATREHWRAERDAAQKRDWQEGTPACL